MIDNSHTWRVDRDVFSNYIGGRLGVKFGAPLTLAMGWIHYDALNNEYTNQHHNLHMFSLEKPSERPLDYGRMSLLVRLWEMR